MLAVLIFQQYAGKVNSGVPAGCRDGDGGQTSPYDRTSDPDAAKEMRRRRGSGMRAPTTPSPSRSSSGDGVCFGTLSLRGDEQVMDAGAGTGRLTALLLDRLPRGRAVAVDRSVNMTRVARETLASIPNADVVAADLSDLPFVGAFDVVFSTATFHWVRDHDRLFASLFAVLAAGRSTPRAVRRRSQSRAHPSPRARS